MIVNQLNNFRVLLSKADVIDTIASDSPDLSENDLQVINECIAEIDARMDPLEVKPINDLERVWLLEAELLNMRLYLKSQALKEIVKKASFLH